MGSLSTYRTPVFIGLVCVMCFAMVLLLHHCIIIILFCNNRRRRRRNHQQQEQEEQDEQEDMEEGSSSRVHLVKGAAAIPAAVVSPYRKDDSWTESTCPVCLADFADGEPVRVLPECMHYFHVECIDTWLRGGSTSCPLCRAETTPTPSPAHLQRNLSLSVSVSLEEILVRT